METDYLERIGLTKNQSLVYLSLLKLGTSTAQAIIKESGMHRAIIYDCLQKLDEISLVTSVIKDYKRYFQAIEPKKLLTYLDEKKEMLLQKLPELERMQNMKHKELNASVFKGREGLKTIHSEMLKEGKEVFVLGAKGLIFSELPYFIPNFERERLRKRIKFTLIYDKKEIQNYEKEIINRQLFEGKTFPTGFDTNTVVNIFGNKVAIVSWQEKNPTGFMINDQNVANSFRKWFNFIYQHCE